MHEKIPEIILVKKITWKTWWEKSFFIKNKKNLKHAMENVVVVRSWGKFYEKLFIKNILKTETHHNLKVS